MTNASTFSPFVTDFSSTSAMPLSNSSWSSIIHPVGAAAPAYIGSIQPVRRVPGTGGFNPYGYDEHGGTGFPAPMGNNLLCLLALTIIYLCIKRPPKLYHKSWQRSALIFFVCACCFSASAENGIIPVPTWEPLPFTVCYSHTPLVDRNNPRLVIEVDDVFMVPDDPWWSGREICFEGRFVHGGGETLLTDDYSESTARFARIKAYYSSLIP